MKFRRFVLGTWLCGMIWVGRLLHADESLVDRIRSVPAPPTKNLPQSIAKTREQFKDILLAVRPNGSTEATDDLAKIPSDDRTAYLQRNSDEARKVLSAIKPHAKLPEPVLLPQVIRYLNQEMSDQHLPFRVRLYLPREQDDTFEAERLRQQLFCALPGDAQDLKFNGPSLSKALAGGSLWDILQSVTLHILPHASCTVHAGGVIIVAPFE